MGFVDLSDEVILLILAYTDIPELLDFSRVRTSSFPDLRPAELLIELYSYFLHVP